MRATLAGVVTLGELTVSVPVAAALVAGANATDAVQYAPASRLPAHVFCVRTNGGETAIAIEIMLKFEVFVTVTVCDGVACPGLTAAKLSSVGFTLSPEASCAVPLSVTVAGLTPSVEEDTASVAAIPPPTMGLKTTCAVHEDPPFNVDPHVVALT